METTTEHPSATIIITRLEDPFSRVNKDMLKDSVLSWKAKGILSYLLGQKQGWKAQVSDLVNKSKDGESSVRAGLKELRDNHYAKLEQLREAGKVKEWVLRVSDAPTLPPEKTESEPDSGILVRENLNLGNRPLSKNGASVRADLKQEPELLPSVSEQGTKPVKQWSPDPMQKRFNSLFQRRDTTKWVGKELKAYRALLPINEEDMELLERHYAMNIPKDEDYRRRELSTLLNNFNGAVDKARAAKPSRSF